MRLVSLLLVLFLAGCQLPFYSPQKSNVHLVIDAGSSGTRFCPYRISEQCIHLDLSQNCFSIQASGGLADLNPSEIRQVMQSGFAQLQGMDIEKTVVLGTGGFRRLPSHLQAQKLNLVASTTREFFEPSEARILTGEQEAQLAYLAMVAFRDGKRDHVILETGGATVQLAGQGLKPRSVPAGLNAIRELSGPPHACKENTAPSADRFLECTQALKRILKSRPWYSSFFAGQKPESVYTLGSSWKSIYALAGDSELTLEELKKQGIRICNSSTSEIVDAGVPEQFAPASCYLHSYQYALTSELQIGSLKAGEGSWPPGAAISEYFSGCNSAIQ